MWKNKETAEATVLQCAGNTCLCNSIQNVEVQNKMRTGSENELLSYFRPKACHVRIGKQHSKMRSQGRNNEDEEHCCNLLLHLSSLFDLYISLLNHKSFLRASNNSFYLQNSSLLTRLLFRRSQLVYPCR